VEFSKLRLDRIKTVVRYCADISEWSACNRRDHIIGINISGKTDHDLGYKRMDLGPDYIYFFNQRDDYKATVRENGYCYSVHFTTTEPIETDSFCKKVNNAEEVVKLIRQVERARLRGDGELRTCAEFYTLCDLLHRLYTAPYGKRDERMTDAKAYMDVHFSEADCLAQAVRTSGVSARRFNDIFKQSYGQTPNVYIVTKRVRYAAELLAIGYLGVADIAERAGFSDVYYFNKTFKQYMGQTPGRYRKDGGRSDMP
jgi:AraC-like DNA-binding protein